MRNTGAGGSKELNRRSRPWSRKWRTCRKGSLTLRPTGDPSSIQRLAEGKPRFRLCWKGSTENGSSPQAHQTDSHEFQHQPFKGFPIKPEFVLHKRTLLEGGFAVFISGQF